MLNLLHDFLYCLLIRWLAEMRQDREHQLKLAPETAAMPAHQQVHFHTEPMHCCQFFWRDQLRL